MALVQREPHVDQIPQEVDKLLAGGLHPLDDLEGGTRRQHGLKRPDQHHHDHHDGKDRNRVAGHVHYQQVHRELLDRAERNVPGLLQDQMALVVVAGHLAVDLAGGRVETGRGGDVAAAAGSVKVRLISAKNFTTKKSRLTWRRNRVAI